MVWWWPTPPNTTTHPTLAIYHLIKVMKGLYFSHTASLWDWLSLKFQNNCHNSSHWIFFSTSTKVSWKRKKHKKSTEKKHYNCASHNCLHENKLFFHFNCDEDPPCAPIHPRTSQHICCSAVVLELRLSQSHVGLHSFDMSSLASSPTIRVSSSVTSSWPTDNIHCDSY